MKKIMIYSCSALFLICLFLVIFRSFSAHTPSTPSESSSRPFIPDHAATSPTPTPQISLLPLTQRPDSSEIKKNESTLKNMLAQLPSTQVLYHQNNGHHVALSDEILRATQIITRVEEWIDTHQISEAAGHHFFEECSLDPHIAENLRALCYFHLKQRAPLRADEIEVPENIFEIADQIL